jgi:hypothetical protein
MPERKEYRYGTPIPREELPKPTKRLPEYDECLREFMSSGHDIWKINLDALPGKNMRVVLSSLKWRTKHKREFKKIKVFMRKNSVYLERELHFEEVKDNE